MHLISLHIEYNPKSKISSLKPSSVGVQYCLGRTWSHRFSHDAAHWFKELKVSGEIVSSYQPFLSFFIDKSDLDQTALCRCLTLSHTVYLITQTRPCNIQQYFTAVKKFQIKNCKIIKTLIVGTR